jgi:hypothetical protein
MAGPQNAGLVGGSYYSGTLAPGPAPAPAPGPIVPGVNPVDYGNYVPPEQQATVDAQHYRDAQVGAGAGYMPSGANPAGNAPPGYTGPVPPQGQAPNPFSSIDTFPGVANAQALENMGIGQNDAALRSQIQQAIINFGDPALAQMAGFGLDPQAGAFAQQNYLSGNSTLARLNHQHSLAAQSIVNQLAAHGILNSGDLGYREGQENQGYGNTVYDAQQSVLGQIAQWMSDNQQRAQGLHQHTSDAWMQAYNDYINNPDAFAGMFSGGANTAPASTSPTPPNATGKTVKTTPASRSIASQLSSTHINGYGGRY